jgi:ring-1,2-phenylacetyl-CoA epoxidase subunit PaaA
MMMFGPPDNDSPNTPILRRWGIKTKTNDELRQTFVDQIVPELHTLGLSIPDPDLELDPITNHWKYGQINWDEFRQVIQGHGPCNKERLSARRQAHENGQWVREALDAYAQKTQ